MHMTLSQVIQTIAIIVSLFVSGIGWFINQRGRRKDAIPKFGIAIMSDRLDFDFGKQNGHFPYLITIKNIGSTTGVVTKFIVFQHLSNGKLSRLTPDKIAEAKIAYPILPRQALNYGEYVDPSKDYYVEATIKDQYGIERSQVQELNGKLISYYKPTQVMEMD